MRVAMATATATAQFVLLGDRDGDLISRTDRPARLHDFLLFCSWGWLPGSVTRVMGTSYDVLDATVQR